ncbi:hypothetical protein [Domibacillus aminovorans]|uniref:RanBP2-type domain-containing protein n=1 Tax=Domibacillus aminovorans TaxID=29332 RepID=A0A177L882_9BACI|nr:hypothetical protein [Domibacillus aminovorans]OAH61684.1 hypothetical protein AWH49_12100 [Domibacillus aminovorans]
MSEKHWKCSHCKHDNDKHRKNCERCNSHHHCKHDDKKGKEDKKRKDQDDLKVFRYDEPRNMPQDRPLKTVFFEEEDVLAKIKFCPKKDKCDHHKDNCEDAVVWLAATVGWKAARDDIRNLIVEFKIRKGSRDGDVIFATRQGASTQPPSGDGGDVDAQTTTFIHVDHLCKNKFTTCPGDDDDELKYFLTAEVITSGDAASIVGPVVFTATKIS